MGANALIRCVLLVGALFLPSACAVQTVDCWQLNDQELADARKHGRCGDAFARNHQEIVPVGSVTPPQRRKPRPPSAQHTDDPESAIVATDARKKRKPGGSPTPTQSAQSFP